MADKNTSKSQHYVQQAYQKGFYADEKTDYWVLDKTMLVRPDGNIEGLQPKKRGARVSFEDTYFYASDYYPEKDYLEKEFFGPIDTLGAVALQYMLSGNKNLWPSANVGTDFLNYISAQKFRTPKGLDLLRQAMRPNATKEELLEHLQEVHRNMTITLGESVIEILDARKCEVKFIVSDNPVVEWHKYISQENTDNFLLKGTQVIFPISKDFCLVSTPRELANGDISKQDYFLPRENARKYGNLIFDVRKLQNERTVNSDEVSRINKAIKENALQGIAGAEKDYLFPESTLFLEDVLKPQNFKRSGGISYVKNGKIVGFDEYGNPLKGDALKSMEDFHKFAEKKRQDEIKGIKKNKTQ